MLVPALGKSVASAVNAVRGPPKPMATGGGAFGSPPNFYWSMAGANLAAALAPTLGATALTSNGTGVSLSSGVTPRGGNAILFSGSHNGASLALALINIYTPPFTLMFFARPDASGSGADRVLVGGNQINGGNNWHVQYGPQTSWAFGRYGVASYQPTNRANGWGSVCIRAGSGEFPYYTLNGDIAGTFGQPFLTSTDWVNYLGGSTSMNFGYGNGWGGPFIGAIADIAGWTRELTNTEVADAYAWNLTKPFAV